MEDDDFVNPELVFDFFVAKTKGKEDKQVWVDPKINWAFLSNKSTIMDRITARRIEQYKFIKDW